MNRRSFFALFGAALTLPKWSDPETLLTDGWSATTLKAGDRFVLDHTFPSYPEWKHRYPPVEVTYTVQAEWDADASFVTGNQWTPDERQASSRRERANRPELSQTAIRCDG